VDSYKTGFDSYGTMNASVWRAQSFTTTAAYTITSVKLMLNKNVGAHPGTLHVGIYAVDGSFKPTGTALCSGTLNANNVTEDVAGAWYSISLGAGSALTITTKYAIVCWADADGLVWCMDGSGPVPMLGAMNLSLLTPD